MLLIQSQPKSEQSFPSFGKDAVYQIEQLVWALESYGDPDNLQLVELPLDSEIIAKFEVGSASASGYGGCNWYKAKCMIAGNELTITPQTFTKRACLSSRVQQLRAGLF